MANKKNEFYEFDRTINRLLSVSHDEVKRKLDAENAAKKRKKSKASSASREVNVKD